MKTLVRVLICAVVFVSLPSLVSAQQGYSVADNGQRLIQFDVTTGSATDVGPVNTNTEQEGLFSSGSFLMGYSEFDSALASPDLQNPGTRFLPTPGGANPNPAICSFSGARFGTESGAAYNPVDGYVYVVNSDDLIPAGSIRSRFFRFKPNCSGFQELGAGSTLYVDGVAVDGQGNIFMSALRTVGAGQIYLFGGGTLFPLPQPLGLAGVVEDSGLAFDFANDRLYGLAELGRVFQINPATGAIVPGSTRTVTLPGGAVPTEMEGFDIPTASPIP